MPVLAATDSASTHCRRDSREPGGGIVAPADPEALARAAFSIAWEWTAEDSQAGPAHVECALSEHAGVAQFETLLIDAATKDREFAPRKGEMTHVALITGITGQDGSYLAEFLLAKGTRYTA